jgi:uncharacterized protein (TIGR03083 family)
MSWNFMDPASRSHIDRVWRRESDGMLALAADPAAWEAPTRAGDWQVRDVIGHLVDTTEAYFLSFDAARGAGTVPDPLGLADMATHVDAGARALRHVPQADLLERLRACRNRMLGIAAELTDQEWAELMVPHKYMGPLPAAFYPIFQVVDYTVHSWDIREGTGRAHGLSGDAADLLVPLCFVLWQYTCAVPGSAEPSTLGIRITSGANAGDTQASVSADGIAFAPGSVEGLAEVIEFDPASFVLTAYGRTNAGTYRGNRDVLDGFCNLFFRI